MRNAPKVAADRALTLFKAVVDLPPEKRAAYVDHARLSPDVREELEALLARNAHTARIDLPRAAPSDGIHALHAMRTAASRAALAFPTRAGRYTLHAELGAGGHGVVYRATQEHPRREVALKVLRGGGAATRDRALAEVEAETIARLRHPGIAQVYDAGRLTIDGTEHPFLAMELVDGAPLMRWRATTGPTLASRVRVLIDACDATEAAHRRGVVHCDLKPDNILVEDALGGPRPRILDFGVARIVGTDRTAIEGPRGLTGTFAYMSPEQAAGAADLDARTDVFSLGAVAYELLAGARAFDTHGQATRELTQRIKTEAPVPLSGHDRRLGGDLERIVARAMAKDRDARYPSAGALADDLRRYLAHRPVSVRAPDPWYLLTCFARRRRGACAALAVTTLALVGALGFCWASSAHTSAALDRLISTAQFTVAEVVGRLEHLSGTTEVRTAALQQLLPQVESLILLRPRDPTVLTCRATIFRHMGSMALANQEWATARALRERVLADSERLHLALPTDPRRMERWATDLVLLGDVHREIGGPAAAQPMYARAHAVFADLARAHPEVAYHLDGLAWSHDRLAFLAIELGELETAEKHLEQRAALLDRLEVRRPGSIHNLSGRRALYCLYSHLERSRGRLDACLDYLRRSIPPARARLELQPHDVGAVLDFAGSITTLANDSPTAPLDAELATLCIEARQAVQRLLAYDPDSHAAQTLLRELAAAEQR